jgi:mono/diheme cytochrome c family protein
VHLLIAIALFDQLCVPCHGARGDGAGPAAPWVWPRPRDLTAGDFVWGARDEDLAATIRWGVDGAMPAFALDDAQIAALIADLRTFAGPAPKQGKPRTLPSGQGDAERGAAVWTEAGCTSCHGDQVPRLERPHAPGDELDAIARSVAWGAGTMPSYQDALSAEDLWSVVRFVDDRRDRSRRVALAAEAIDLDRTAKIASGTWPGTTDVAAEAALFGGAIAPQGEPPESLAPAQASLSSRQCGRCHKKQVREWTGSLHGAAISPGFRAQLTRQKTPSGVAGCLRCHAPLPEQTTDDALHAEGVTCAVCHVRGWTRHGPPGVSPSLLTLPTYPFEPLAIYERSDLCLPCHQLPPRLAVAGRPLLDTYREWLNGPYMRRGIQCQSCHMPNREHQFLGVHDPETFRQGIRVEAIAARGDTGVVSVRARLWNVGAGHMLPTTATPAAWLAIELVDARGKPIAGARAEQRIGRDIAYGKDGWIDLEDTRVAPGASIEVAGGWKNGRVAEATHVRVTVRVSPDEYYRRLYVGRIERTDGELRDLYQVALDRAEDNVYVAEDRLVEIE